MFRHAGKRESLAQEEVLARVASTLQGGRHAMEKVSERQLRDLFHSLRMQLGERLRKDDIDVCSFYVQAKALDKTLKDALTERRERLQDACVSCLNDIPVWQFPCKHLVYCKKCMRTAKKKAAKEKANAGKADAFATCPLCRGPGPARMQ